MKRIGVAVLASLLVTTAVAASEPNDAQIAAIVVTANQVDIDAGKLATSKSHNVDVKGFAERMVTDHTGVNKSAVDLVTKLKVTPEDSPTAQSLKAGGDENLLNLRSLLGVAFDKAPYVTHEVAYHQQVLDALDKVLIPSAQNPELKALLVKVRPAFVAHLEMAKRIEASLAEKSGVSSDGRSPPLRPAVRGYPGLRPASRQYQQRNGFGPQPSDAHGDHRGSASIGPRPRRGRRGDTVIWINRDPFPHTATANGGRFDSHAIEPGRSWTFTPKKAGVISYGCTYHPTMKGTLRVE